MSFLDLEMPRSDGVTALQELQRTAPRVHLLILTTARGRFKTPSDREQTILTKVAQGYSGVEIARTLHISTKMVDAYKHRIEDKLRLSHRTHYVRFGIEAGILSAVLDASL